MLVRTSEAGGEGQEGIWEQWADAPPAPLPGVGRRGRGGEGMGAGRGAGRGDGSQGAGTGHRGRGQPSWGSSTASPSSPRVFTRG